MARIVRVGFSQRGGFAPTWRGCDVDVRSLPAEEALTLQGLIAASGIQTMRDIRLPGADMVTYTFSIDADSGTHLVTIDAPGMPESVRPLLQYLSARSRNLLDGS